MLAPWRPVASQRLPLTTSRLLCARCGPAHQNRDVGLWLRSAKCLTRPWRSAAARRILLSGASCGTDSHDEPMVGSIMPRWTTRRYRPLCGSSAKEQQRNAALSPYVIEYLLLTACRSSEVVGMQWSEVDLDNKFWIVPTERTKARREHRVPLSERAVELLAQQRKISSNSHVWQTAKTLSASSPSTSFSPRTWASE
jgi:integrase